MYSNRATQIHWRIQSYLLNENENHYTKRKRKYARLGIRIQNTPHKKTDWDKRMWIYLMHLLSKSKQKQYRPRSGCNWLNYCFIIRFVVAHFQPSNRNDICMYVIINDIFNNIRFSWNKTVAEELINFYQLTLRSMN